MAKIIWTDEAVDWLRDIYDHIAQDNPDAAERVVAGIIEKAKLLSDFPEIGHIYRRKGRGEIRILLYGHYRIAYLKSLSEEIHILGVFHGALDMEKRLR